MKQFIKSMIPNRMLPVAQRIYWHVVDASKAVPFSADDLNALPALRCLVSYNRYGGYCVPVASRHRIAARKILANDVYEPDTIAFMTTHCGTGDIVHAGTYFGDFLPALSVACTDGSKVWAFEPNPENYQCAKITMEINRLANVELINAGLGARRRTVHLKTVDDTGRALGGASQIVEDVRPHDPEGKRRGTEIIHVVPVDEVVGPDRRVSILQLDVEGHEKEALEGALGTIRRCRPVIILEVWPGSTLLNSDWFLENILSLGYHRVGQLHDNAVYQCETPGPAPATFGGAHGA